MSDDLPAQILSRYRQLINWLLPDGSLRHDFFYNRCLGLVRKNFRKSLDIIKTEGFGSLIKRSARKIERDMIKTVKISRNIWYTYILPPSMHQNKYDVIFFYIVNWGCQLQRPQQIASRFAKNGHRVFYLDIHLKKQRTYTRAKVSEKIYKVTLPFGRNATIYNVNLQQELGTLISAFRKLFDDFLIKEAVAMVGYPAWYPVVNHLKNEYNIKVVFDYMDELAGFQNADLNIIRQEDMMTKASDYCIATSRRLYEKIASRCGNVALVRNAIEFEHFNRLPPNNKLKRLKKPVIGYYGRIAEWFDTETVEYIAAQRPDWSIVLIGHIDNINAGSLKSRLNIHLPGEVHYAKLPKFLYWFDTCIIPFKVNELTIATNPGKFYEFISSGKPVVASKLPELLPYSDYLYLAEGKEEFLRNIEVALHENDPGLKNRRIMLARENNWDNRFEAIKTGIKAVYPLVSVVIVTFNNIGYTKNCIESIYAKTIYPNFEVIVVDNSSTDGTPAYLKSLETKYDNIRIILNKVNLGFSRANNIGIKASEGKYLILLNNDTIVTRGWVSGLVKYFKDPTIGMVGPVTNSISNEAQINVDYTNHKHMDVFSEIYTTKNRGKSFDIKMLAMFCTAIPRRVIDEVGLLDENFCVGMFEDDDFSYRVRRKGFKIICTEDVFVHHAGMASFRNLKEEHYRKIFEQNRKYFETKWGIKWEPHKYRT